MMRVAVVVLAAAFALQGCSLLDLNNKAGRPQLRQGPGRGGPPTALAAALQRFDTNGDKMIAIDEMDGVLKTEFAAADRNGDGELSFDEAEPLNAGLTRESTVSPVRDWNGDGHVDLREFGSQWRTLFARADADRDNTLSVAELTQPVMGDQPPGKRRPPSSLPPAFPKGADQSGRESGL